MHPHTNQNIEKRFLIALAITIAILLAEVAGGLWTGSLALLSDSAHVFMDIFALGLSYTALRISARPPDDRHTYGYHRLEVLAAFVNGISLVTIGIGIFIEAYHRWQNLQPVKSVEMLAIAVVGLVANLVAALVLRGEHQPAPGDHRHAEDLNLHSAFLHVLGDAISSVGVIVAAVVIWRTGWLWVDPVVSVLIGGIILLGSCRVLRSSLHILVEGVPEGLHLVKVQDSMLQVAGVTALHDLHVWNICSERVALSAHVVLNEGADSAGVMLMLKDNLEHFGIEHTIIQFECAHCTGGRLAGCCIQLK